MRYTVKKSLAFQLIWDVKCNRCCKKISVLY